MNRGKADSASRPRRLGLLLGLEHLGSFALLGLGAMSVLVRGKLNRAELGAALLRLGLHSLPVILATSIFTGGLMVVQAAPLLERYGAQSLLGWGAGFGLLREIGPILTGLMISGRVGSANTAELGTLTVTEQFDGLRALAMSPFAYLVAPRMFAIVLTTVVGTLLAMLVSLLGAALVGFGLMGVHPVTFYNGLTTGPLGLADLGLGLFKSLVFGLVIAASSASFGMRAQGGAPGVGRAVSRSVVTSATLIFLLDALISLAGSVHLTV